MISIMVDKVSLMCPSDEFNEYVEDYSFIMIHSLLDTFRIHGLDLKRSLLQFGKFFYTKIRALQTFIKCLK